MDTVLGLGVRDETLKRLSALPILMQNHSGGDSVALRSIVSPFPPTSCDLGPRQYTTSETTRR